MVHVGRALLARIAYPARPGCWGSSARRSSVGPGGRFFGDVPLRQRAAADAPLVLIGPVIFSDEHAAFYDHITVPAAADDTGGRSGATPCGCRR